MTPLPKVAERSGDVDRSKDTTLEYDQFCRAANAERKAGMQLARTKPTSPAGAAALIAHTRREIEAGSEEDWEDWVPTALKTVTDALGRLEAA
jgi:hypothetical protein